MSELQHIGRRGLDGGGAQGCLLSGVMIGYAAMSFTGPRADIAPFLEGSLSSAAVALVEVKGITRLPSS